MEVICAQPVKFQLSETIWWWIEPCGEAPLRRQMNKVILSGPAMASHCCTILYPEMRIRNLIAFAQQMSWTQILMMVSTLRPGLQWLREFGNTVSKIVYKRGNLVSRIHGQMIVLYTLQCIEKYRALLSLFDSHKSPAAVGGEVARNQALKISRLFHEKIKTMVEIKL